jgi:hypothetical protein
LLDNNFSRPLSNNNAPNKFDMIVEFRKISEWKIDQKYYSSPITSNGYSFFFFMRPEIKDADQSTHLAGYLRCTSGACETPNHYLPVNVTFEIVLANGNKRTFPPISFIFAHFDRSFGSRMNVAADNWDKIRTGNSDIVIKYKDEYQNDQCKITVIISVEFGDK